MSVNEPTGFSLTGTDASQTAFKGMKFTMGSTARKLVLATKHANTTGGTFTFQLRASDRTTVLATGSTSGDTATFDYTLAASTTYYIGINGSSTNMAYQDGGTSYPIVGTYLNYVAATDGSTDSTTNMFNILSIDTDVLTTTVSPSALGLTLSLGAPIPEEAMVPSALALTLSLQAPTITILQTFAPSALALTLSLVYPAIHAFTPIPTHVTVKTGKIGSAVVKSTYPAVDGLTAGTTTQEGHEEYLQPEENYTTASENKGVF